MESGEYFFYYSAFDEDWHRMMARKQDKKIAAQQNTSRFRELVTCESLADAMTSAEVPLAALRVLACTCTMWRAKILAFYKLPKPLVLRPVDCTDANAAFVAGPLVRQIHPGVVLRMQSVEPGGGRAEIEIALADWLRFQEYDTRGDFGDTFPYCSAYPRKTSSWRWGDEMGTTCAFFLGRAIATLHRAFIDVVPNKSSLSRKRICTENVRPHSWPQGITYEEQCQLTPMSWRVLAGCYTKRAVAQLVDSRFSSLVDANLNGVHLDDAGAQCIAHRVTRLKPSLMGLHLSGTFTSVSYGLFGFLGKKDGVDPSKLEALCLSGNRFDDACVTHLVSVVKKGGMQSLTWLDLSQTQMGTQRFQRMADLFSPHGGLGNRLKFLDLSSNDLGKEALNSFMKSARWMTALKRLKIHHNLFSRCALVKFAQWIGNKSYWCQIKHVETDAKHQENGEDHEYFRKAIEYRQARTKWERFCMQQADPEHHNAPAPDASSSDEYTEEEEDVEEENAASSSDQDDYDCD
jgi:hypothetical protein